MTRGKTRSEITLLDILIDGFEKNEVLYGFHWRDLPMTDEAEAIRKFGSLVEEARRWKVPPLRSRDDARRFAAWEDLEIRQAGRGIMVRVRSPWFSSWWHDRATWDGDPMGPVHDWIREESAV